MVMSSFGVSSVSNKDTSDVGVSALSETNDGLLAQNISTGSIGLLCWKFILGSAAVGSLMLSARLKSTSLFKPSLSQLYKREKGRANSWELEFVYL